MKVSKKQREQEEEGAMDSAGAGVGKGAEEGVAGGGGGGGTVVVGVRADAESRALLTWTFVNAVAAGDRVVAVHVVLASGAEAAAAVDFDSMLAVYEGFCNLKQVSRLPIPPLSVSLCLSRRCRFHEFWEQTSVAGVQANTPSTGRSLCLLRINCCFSSDFEPTPSNFICVCLVRLDFKKNGFMRFSQMACQKCNLIG